MDKNLDVRKEGAEAEVKKISSFFTEKQVFVGEKAKKDILVARDLS